MGGNHIFDWAKTFKLYIAVCSEWFQQYIECNLGIIHECKIREISNNVWYITIIGPTNIQSTSTMLLSIEKATKTT